MERTTAKQRYEALVGKRDPFLRRGRDASKLTIPSLLPPDSHNGHDKLPTPFQSLGARGVNNLSNKLLMALMPPNSPFFRLTIDDYTLEELVQEEGARAEVEEALGRIERAVLSEMEAQAIRVGVGEALKQLIVSGNVLLYLNPEGGLRVFRLDRYVARRDPMGNVLEIITHETVSPLVLSPEIRESIQNEDTSGDRLEKTIDLYTRIYLEENKWKVFQEVKGVVIPESIGDYPKDKSPWIPLRFSRIDGEDYGRGYVEEYYGDLRSLEALTKAIVEGSAAASKVLFFVNPNGVTSMKTVSESESGDVKSGEASDISVLQMDKFADFRVAFESIRELEQRLAFAFLMNTAIQRDAERVTAEEVRYMALELEDALGGVYSILSLELQLPMVQRLMHQLEKANKIPRLPKGMVKPAITTGLEALGRGHDLNKLDAFIGGVMQTLGGEVIMQYLNVGDYLKRRGTALGIDMKGLIKSEEQIQAEQQAQQEAMQEQMMQQMMAQGGMDMAKEVVKEGAQGD